MFYTYWYISRKLDSKKLIFHIQSRVYPLSFIVNFRTCPGPVLSLFGLKDRRTGPFKKARTVDTLPSMHISCTAVGLFHSWGARSFPRRVFFHSFLLLCAFGDC